MADLSVFYLETDLSKFLESVLQKAENVLQDVDNQTQVDAEVHVEVVDQTVSLIQALQETSDVQVPSDINGLGFTCRRFRKCAGIVMESHYYQCSISNNPCCIIYNTKKEIERETWTIATVF